MPTLRRGRGHPTGCLPASGWFGMVAGAAGRPRIGRGGETGPGQRRLRRTTAMDDNRGGLAVYVTSHGFGHLNRTVAVLNRLPADLPMTIRCKPDLFAHWGER